MELIYMSINVDERVNTHSADRSTSSNGTLQPVAGHEVRSLANLKAACVSRTLPFFQRIPDNWYRRPLATPYGLIELVEDICKRLCLPLKCSTQRLTSPPTFTPYFVPLPRIVRVNFKAPERFALGGNLGVVNSFRGLSAHRGGASPDLFANGTNPLCFGAQVILP